MALSVCEHPLKASQPSRRLRGQGIPETGLPGERTRSSAVEGWAGRLFGFKLLPVAGLDEPAPEGKALAGRDAVILEDRVELRPIWADIPPPPSPPSLEEVKAARKTEATAMREQARARGVVFGEARLAAMPEDQGAYGDAITYLGWEPEGAILKWKAASGWIELDLPALRAAAEAVGDFIEALFEIEHNHHAAIDALTGVAAVQAYDVAAGWPE